MSASKSRKHFASWLLLLLLVIPTAGMACTVDSVPGSIRAADHHLVLFHGSVAEFERAVRAAGGSVDRVWAAIGVARVHGLSAQGASQLGGVSGIRAVHRDRDVQWLDGFSTGKTVAVQYAPVMEGEAAGQPTFASAQWNIEQIAANDARALTLGLRGTRVGILSTGISPEHIDLEGRYDLMASVNLSLTNPTDVRDYVDRHMQGSILSALIASNRVGMESIAPKVALVGIKVFSDDGRASIANIIDGIMYAADAARTDILLLGVDHGPTGPEFTPLMEMLNLAVRHAIDNGVFVVAAVGGCEDAMASASLGHAFSSAGALLIGASMRAADGGCGAVACYGGKQSSISLYAPGGGRDCPENSFGSISDMIVSALSPEVARRMELPQPDSWYVFSSSAGIAAAHVAGVAALLKSVSRDARPAAIVNQLIRSARQPDDGRRHGELNASVAARR